MAPRGLQEGLRTLESILQSTPVSPASGIVRACTIVIEAILQRKSNSADAQRIGERVLDIGLACSQSIQGKEFTVEMQFYAKDLAASLDRLAATLQKQQNQHWIGRTVRRAAHSAAIKSAQDDLERILSVFSLHTQLANLRLVSEVDSSESDHSHLIKVEDTIAKAHTEELELMRAQLKDNTSSISARSFTKPLPPAPQIFYGRDQAVIQIVEMLSSSEQKHAAILGSGGIGKTSLAIAAMHHPALSNVYGQYRYFIPCDAINDADGLQSSLSSLFKISEKRFWQELRRTVELIESKILFAFDNFETPWDSPTQRKAVEAFLSKLSELPFVSCLITLRGAERPYGALWSRPFLPPLKPLDFEAALQTFVDISDAEEDAEGLEGLLNAVDCIPLGVTLIAAQAQYTSCAVLLKNWNLQKTSMVTRGHKDRLSNLDVSIQVSLQCERMLACPEAISVLQVLSLLPDGATIEELESMVPPNVSISTASQVLLQTALAHRDEGERIKSLSPVREHVKAYMLISTNAFRPLFHFYQLISKKAIDNEYTANRSLMIEEVGWHHGNLHSVIYHALTVDELVDAAVRAAFDVTHFHKMSFKGSIVTLLDTCLSTAKKLGSRSSEALSLEALAKPAAASDGIAHWETAIGIWRELERDDDLCRVLIEYGYGLIWVGQTNDAIKAFTEAIEKMADNDSASKALTYHHLSLAHTHNGSIVKALEACEAGIAILDIKTYPVLASRIYLQMGSLYGWKSIFPTGEYYFKKGQELLGSEDDIIAGDFFEGIGQTLMLQSQLKEAEPWFLKMLHLFMMHQRPDYAPAVHRFLGLTAFGLNDFDNARKWLHLGAKGSEQYSNLHIQLACLSHLGSLELAEGNIGGAEAYLLQASNILPQKKMNQTPNRWLFLLFFTADFWLYRQNSDEALVPAVIAAIVCRTIPDRLGLAMAVQRLGDSIYMDSELEAARACYDCSLNLIRYIGVTRHIADLLLRLGIVSVLQGDRVQANKRLQQAKQFYEKSCDSSGFQFSEEILTDSESVRGQDIDRKLPIPRLPLGNILY